MKTTQELLEMIVAVFKEWAQFIKDVFTGPYSSTNCLEWDISQ